MGAHCGVAEMILPHVNAHSSATRQAHDQGELQSEVLGKIEMVRCAAGRIGTGTGHSRCCKHAGVDRSPIRVPAFFDSEEPTAATRLPIHKLPGAARPAMRRSVVLLGGKLRLVDEARRTPITIRGRRQFFRDVSSAQL